MKFDPVARQQLSQVGFYASWYLRRSQLDLYDLLLKEKRAFLECARRFGKTTSILSFVLEKLRQNPGWVCRWCLPFKNQAREIVMPEIDKLQKWTPEHLKFKYQTTDSVYNGPGGSRFYLRGVNEDRGESARGPAANIIVCDEYGFWKDAKYIVDSVLDPQLEKQEGQWLIKASTPPPDLGHIYYEERERAAKLGRLITKTIYDNESLSPHELQEIIDEAGGVDSPAFRRERLCEPVSDPRMLIIPEWNDEFNIVDDDYPRPEYFTPYVGGDSGADDNTAILFGYYDFNKNEKVIEAEYVINGRTTAEIVGVAKEIEKTLWDDKPPKKRVYDADKQLIFDIFLDHKWPVQMPDKADKIASIHDLRVEVQARRFKVKRRCTNLARQMKVGMWRDDKHQDFQRSEGLGHLDCIAAALYFNRSIDLKLNPVPQNLGLGRGTHIIHPSHAVRRDSTEDALSKVFGRSSKRG
jgi:hypothetical protein